MSHSSSTVERERKGRIIPLFCVAGLVSARVTLRLLKSFPELLLPPILDPHSPEFPSRADRPWDALCGPDAHCGNNCCQTRAGRAPVSARRVGIGTGNLLGGVLLSCGSLFLLGSLLLLVAGPVFALSALPLGFFASGAITVVFAAGAIRIVTSADTRHRIWPWTLGVGVGVALLGVAFTGMDWRNPERFPAQLSAYRRACSWRDHGPLVDFEVHRGNTPNDVNEAEKQYSFRSFLLSGGGTHLESVGSKILGECPYSIPSCLWICSSGTPFVSGTMVFTHTS
jgi:hypothetical protein